MIGAMGVRRPRRGSGPLLVLGVACLAGGFWLMVLGLNDTQPLVTFGRDPEPDELARGHRLLWTAAGLHVVAAAALSRPGSRPALLALVASPGAVTAGLSYVETRSALAWGGLALLGPVAVLAAAALLSRSGERD